MTGGWFAEVPTGSTIWITSNIFRILEILLTAAFIKEISKTLLERMDQLSPEYQIKRSQNTQAHLRLIMSSQ